MLNETSGAKRLCTPSLWVSSMGFYSAADNKGSPLTLREKYKILLVARPSVCFCALSACVLSQSMCVCVRACVWSVKGKAAGFMCVRVSFYASLGECLFLDWLEGQGLATDREKLCSY